MKKICYILAALAISGVLSGCSGNQPAAEASKALPTETAAGSSAAESTVAAFTEAAGDTANAPAPDAITIPDPSAADTASIVPEDVTVRIGSLKGPTSMGLVWLMEQSKKGAAGNQYEFTMVTAADELLAKVASGELDIALIPANVASVLYNKTQGKIAVIDINTLGVLDIVAADDSIQSIADLKGRTVYMTGKGTTPDYVFRYLMSGNGLSEADLTLEFKSEPTEVAALLKEQPDAIGLLPQPFVTAACAQNESLKIVLDLTEEWEKIQSDSKSRLVTGVTVVRRPFLEENPNAVALFLAEHQASAAFTASNPDAAAELIADLGIIEKAPIAKKSLPYCNITCLTGEEMKDALSGYLQVLYEQDPASVGGKLPEDDFYYYESSALRR
ncbi:MAG: ABC transporter substrate-binding protein [Lachnospiraceae bacterium]|nr:ABC transporter substrate-binding protein [Lachnospiraceae bacterium]